MHGEPIGHANYIVKALLTLDKEDLPRLPGADCDGVVPELAAIAEVEDGPDGSECAVRD